MRSPGVTTEGGCGVTVTGFATSMRKAFDGVTTEGGCGITVTGFATSMRKAAFATGAIDFGASMRGPANFGVATDAEGITASGGVGAGTALPGSVGGSASSKPGSSSSGAGSKFRSKMPITLRA